MRLIGDSASLADARDRLAGRSLSPEQRRDAQRWLTDAAFERVKAVLAAVDHEAEGATPEQIAAAFDRAAAISPEAGVALYSLGDPALLEAITGEVAGWIDSLGLIGSERRMLEVGCGIGRFLIALAPRLELAMGLDISARMVSEAARRCLESPTVAVARGSGRDLACVATASVDLVLFADTFPYLVQVGQGLPERHFAEAARVLRPGGRLLVLNYSYRGDPERDAVEAASLASAAGLSAMQFVRSRFQGWDATPFLFGL